MIWLGAADALRLGASLVLFGAALFPIYAREAAPLHLIRWSAVVAAGFGVIATSLHAQAFGATASQLLDTGIGRVWSAQILLAVVIAALSFWKRATPAIAGLAAVGLGLSALVGHANAIAGWRGASLEALHLLAAGGWIGGLAALLLQLRASPSAEMAMRFSRAGLCFVVVIGLTGGAILFLVTGAALPMTDFAYGRLVTWKIALFAAALALAAFNRLLAAPRGMWSALRNSVALEVALLAFVIAVAVALAGTEPLA